jgi:hypothetical protein
LPEGVEFADSSKWGEEVQLKFTSSFQQGDSISVRPANRCYLGERQVFLVNEFNAVLESHPVEYNISVVGNQLMINVTESSKWNYSVYDIMGKQMTNGSFVGNHKSIDLNSSWSNFWYIIKMSNGEKMIHHKFLFGNER